MIERGGEGADRKKERIESITHGGKIPKSLKGAVSQDFLLQIFFMNHP